MLGYHERSALCQPPDPRRHVTERSHRYPDDVQKRKGPRHGSGQRQAGAGLRALGPNGAGGHRSRVRIGGLNAPAALSFWVAGWPRPKPGPALPRCTWRKRRRGPRRTPAAPPRSSTGPVLGTGAGRWSGPSPGQNCAAPVSRRRPLTPSEASTPTAANIESGTAMAPRPLALAIDGRAPERRAAFSHRSQANEPVTNRLGPRLSPIKRAKG